MVVKKLRSLQEYRTSVPLATQPLKKALDKSKQLSPLLFAKNRHCAYFTDTQNNNHDNNNNNNYFLQNAFLFVALKMLCREDQHLHLYFTEEKTQMCQGELLAQGQKAKQGNCFLCQAKTCIKTENKVFCCSFSLFVLSISLPLKVFYVLSSI